MELTEKAAGWAAISSFTGLFLVVLTTFIRDRHKTQNEAATAYKEQLAIAVAQRDHAWEQRDSLIAQKIEQIQVIAELRAKIRYLEGELE